MLEYVSGDCGSGVCGGVSVSDTQLMVGGRGRVKED